MEAFLTEGLIFSPITLRGLLTGLPLGVLVYFLDGVGFTWVSCVLICLFRCLDRNRLDELIWWITLLMGDLVPVSTLLGSSRKFGGRLPGEGWVGLVS